MISLMYLTLSNICFTKERFPNSGSISILGSMKTFSYSSTLTVGKIEARIFKKVTTSSFVRELESNEYLKNSKQTLKPSFKLN